MFKFMRMSLLVYVCVCMLHMITSISICYIYIGIVCVRTYRTACQSQLRHV